MGTGIGIVGQRVAGLDVKLMDTTEESLSMSKSFVGKQSPSQSRDLVRQGGC